MIYHKDILESLNRDISLRDKLVNTHRVMQLHLPFISRVATAIYDPKTMLLKTYVHSSGDEDPLSNYQTPLSEAPSLLEIIKAGHPRVINNMLTFESAQHEHTKRIGRSGYVASYTMPMFYNGVFFGFVFFNSNQAEVFSEKVLEEVDIFGHLISLMVISELSSVRILVAAVATARKISHQRDPETGSHLDRMSRYARLIAKSLAQRYQLDDEYIEHVFMFSPLHDIGKIGIPDSILLKPGVLTENEAKTMRGHVQKGREMIDEMLNNFGLEAIEHADILRNIAEYHHEQINGMGYPNGLKGSEIPLEARIVAVADVFDALTSRRPYKDAWSNGDAFDALKLLSGEKLDGECVQALIDHRTEIEAIQAQFAEKLLG